MSHLKLEALARLVDEEPTADEASHLDRCPACAGELAELRRQTAALAALPPLEAPAGAWRRIEARLEAEGVPQTPPGVRGWGGVGARRIAAAAAIFLLGGLAGYAVAGASPPGPAARTVDAELPPAGGGPYAVAKASPDDVEAAAHAVRVAEAGYLEALSRYQEIAGVGEGEDAYARLAALQGIVLTTRAALDEAPADPLINGYHVTAVAQRDAMLQRIAAAGEEPWF